MLAFLCGMKVTLRFLLVTALFCIAEPSLMAQTKGLGTWNILNVRKQFNKRWNSFFEAQIRSQKTYDDFNYHEYKGGYGYNIAKQFNITLAGGQYVTYRPVGNLKTVTNSEFRLWQQFTLSNNLGRVKVEHRYRIEQRWTSAGYRNRFRYRINTIIPVNSEKVEKGTFYLSVSDEIFLTNQRPHFERNRLFGGGGYMFSELFTLQGGILNQYDVSATGKGQTKSYLQLSLLFSLNEGRSERERHPSTTD